MEILYITDKRGRGKFEIRALRPKNKINANIGVSDFVTDHVLSVSYV